MSLTIYQVDAFTSRPFSGNPAGVCLTEQPLPDNRMQSIAAEMNLAETAFLTPTGDGFQLRWFTPTVEVDLCGHATLASAHILFEIGRIAPGAQARFQTKSGLLAATRNGSKIELDFPAEPPKAVAPPPELLEALGLSCATYTGRNRMDYLVRVDSADTVRRLDPDMTRLARIDTRGVIVTAESTGHDFVSRFFGPGVGVPEDPVTGSAHCALGPYWSEKLKKATVTGFQASARGGVVEVETRGNRVRLRGEAVTVMRCELLV